MRGEPAEVPIRVVEGGPAWARARPEVFFSQGQPSLEELKALLLQAARTLGSARVQDLSFDDWHVVAATDDWLARGATLVAGRSLFHHLHAFPELGQNCSRPEFLVQAFASDVISQGPEGTSVVKGAFDAAAAGWRLAVDAKAWQRVIAFRGLDGRGLAFRAW